VSAQTSSPPAPIIWPPQRSDRPLQEAATAAHFTISVVIPARNEAENLPWLLPRIPVEVDEIILVDGLSTDQSVEVAKMVRADLVIVEESRPGKGAALRAGFERATGDCIVMLDADCSMDPAEIPRFISLLEQGHDMVKGSRFLPDGGTDDMTPLRKVGNKGLLTIANLLFGSRHSDLCYGFVAIRRSLLERMELDADGFEIEMQLVARATLLGARVIEVASFESARMFGNSKLNTFRDGWRVLHTLVRERVRRVEGRKLAGRDPA
jgi:glycosyltransferase involved in cell wall biosynthesis